MSLTATGQRPFRSLIISFALERVQKKLQNSFVLAGTRLLKLYLWYKNNSYATGGTSAKMPSPTFPRSQG